MEPNRAAIDVPTDASVVQKIAAGDLHGLGLLFDRYEGDVRRLLLRLGVSTADLDDVIQTTFLQVIPASKNFDPRYAVRSWLLGIAVIMARRQRRAVGRLATRLATFATNWLPHGPLTPSEAYEHREVGHRLRAALARLSPKRREAFVLVTLHEVPGDEAAAALGIPVNTLWTRLHHARRDMRAWLEREGP